MMDLRHFIDRVLALKSEQDDLSAGIKDIYAEAKSEGFDKTIMGELVTYLRKRERDPLKLEEKGALFATYLHTYESGTEIATRAHAPEAAEPPHNPETGELTAASEGSAHRGSSDASPPITSEAAPFRGDGGHPTKPETGDALVSEGAQAQGYAHAKSSEPAEPIHDLSDPGDIPECLRRNAA